MKCKEGISNNPSKLKRSVIDLKSKKQILSLSKQNWTHVAIAKQLNLARSTVTKILLNKTYQDPQVLARYEDNRKRLRKRIYDDLEIELFNWCVQDLAMSEEELKVYYKVNPELPLKELKLPSHITKKALMEKVKKLANELNYPNFTGTESWFSGFKNRFKLIINSFRQEPYHFDKKSTTTPTSSTKFSSNKLENYESVMTFSSNSHYLNDQEQLNKAHSNKDNIMLKTHLGSNVNFIMPMSEEPYDIYPSYSKAISDIQKNFTSLYNDNSITPHFTSNSLQPQILSSRRISEPNIPLSYSSFINEGNSVEHYYNASSQSSQCNLAVDMLHTKYTLPTSIIPEGTVHNQYRANPLPTTTQLVNNVPTYLKDKNNCFNDTNLNMTFNLDRANKLQMFPSTATTSLNSFLQEIGSNTSLELNMNVPNIIPNRFNHPTIDIPSSMLNSRFLTLPTLNQSSAPNPSLKVHHQLNSGLDLNSAHSKYPIYSNPFQTTI